MALILLVEDSSLVQNMVKSLLEEHSHEVKTAQRALEGIKMIRKDPYDLILMDLNLPGLRGEAAVRVLRQNLRLKTPVIVLSGEITRDVIVSMRHLNIAGFVSKSDYFADNLLKEVDKALTVDT